MVTVSSYYDLWSSGLIKYILTLVKTDSVSMARLKMTLDQLVLVRIPGPAASLNLSVCSVNVEREGGPAISPCALTEI